MSRRSGGRALLALGISNYKFQIPKWKRELPFYVAWLGLGNFLIWSESVNRTKPTRGTFLRRNHAACLWGCDKPFQAAAEIVFQSFSGGRSL
jgi:hypothetical protein